ncbi:hypothetical protein VB713_12410 [Anabaena cylindrica UHCC 0172]|uniref:hypothetical protein n=1 Tax=Anabaena cylindrica TaxID=1165 RepID=UPI002B20E19E|nr:hypothetical protein [Anabaena cylindrica]MEA5551775.1 hypothetical protein [Anabaena cylindrica UHCC 0172]
MAATTRNYGTAKLKNHIPAVAPGVLASMGKLFGVTPETFNKALQGEQNAIKEISDMARLSDVAKANLPKALEAYKKIIETTGDINQAFSELVQLTQKTGTQTIKAINSSTQSEQKMKNELLEHQKEHVNSTTSEATRHTQRVTLIEISGATADLMAIAKHEADMLKASYKLSDAQDSADIAYENAVTAALWSKGSDAQLDRIPKPNYSRTGGLSKVGDWFKNFMGI